MLFFSLQQLSKYTNEDHADSASIKTALLQMEELIFSLNSSIHSSMQAYTSRESEKGKTIRRYFINFSAEQRAGSRACCSESLLMNWSPLFPCAPCA